MNSLFLINKKQFLLTILIAFSHMVVFINKIGVLCNANNKNFPGEKLTDAVTLGSRFVLSLPIIGLHFKFWGLQSVDPKNLKRLMKKNENIALVPGGY
jgi:hypothetical protein